MKWRLHARFEVDRFVPTRIDVTPNGAAATTDGTNNCLRIMKGILLLLDVRWFVSGTIGLGSAGVGHGRCAADATATKTLTSPSHSIRKARRLDRW